MEISKEVVKRLIDDKLLTMRASKTYPSLYVMKYTKKVFFKCLFDEDPLLLEARGLVVDADLNTIVHPMTKVFNRNDIPGADIPGDSTVLLVRKVNGFMGAITWNDVYGWIYSTTGSLDSDFIQYIKDHVSQYEPTLPRIHNTTYLFEVCHEQDPHIVEEYHGAYLIGTRRADGRMESELELDRMACLWGILRPESMVATMRDVNSILKSCQHEGYMVHEIDDDYNQTGKIIKMKSPYYLIRKMIARRKDLDAALINAEKVKETIEEELYCIVDAVKKNKEEVIAMDEQQRLTFMTQVLEKGFA